MNDERYQELRQRLEDLDDAVIVRANALMDIINESHRQSNERIDQLTVNVNQLSQLMAQFIERANTDRALIQQNQTEIRRIWEYLVSQRPNGQQG